MGKKQLKQILQMENVPSEAKQIVKEFLSEINNFIEHVPSEVKEASRKEFSEFGKQLQELVDELFQVQQELTLTNKISNIILRAPDEEMYGEVLQVILDVLNSKFGVFGYIDEEGSLICPSMTRDIWEQCQIPEKDILFPRESWGGIWGRVLIDKRAYYSNGPLKVPKGHIPIIRALCVPIIYQEEIIGILLVGNKALDYDEKDQQLLETIAGYIAPILHARLQRDHQIAQRNQVQKDLIESEDKYKMLVENMMEGVLLEDTNGFITYVNPRITEMSGYSEEELKGKPSILLVAKESRDKVLEEVKKRPHGISSRYEAVFQTKNGQKIPMQVSGASIFTNMGVFQGTLVVLTDITKQKKAKEEITKSKARLDYLLASGPAVIYSCVPKDDYRINFISENIKMITGYESHEVLANPNFIDDRIHPEDRQRIITTLGDISERNNYQTVYRFQHKNGSYVWILEEAKLIFDEQGKILDRIGYMTDITKRMQAEEAMRASEEKYRSFVENFQGIAFKGYQDFSADFFSGNVEGITGFTEDDFIKEKVIYNQLIHPEDLQQVNNDVKDFNSSSRRSTQREYRIIDKNGKIHFVQEYIQKIYDKDKRTTGVYGTVHDITERKLMEDALLESEERYRSIVENTNDVIMLTQPNGIVTYLSPACKDVLGYDPTELVGSKAWIIHPDDSEKGKKAYSKALKGKRGLNFEYRVITKQGDVKYISHSWLPIKQENKIHLVVSVIRDITERKTMEEALQASEEQYRLILNSMGDAIHVTDKDSRIILVNPALENWVEILGFETAPIGKTVLEAYPFLPNKILDEYQQVLDTGKTLVTEEDFVINEREYYAETRKIPIFNLGKVFQIVTIVRDITERKKAEEALKESEEKFRTMAERTSDWIWEVDTNGIYTYASPKVKDILGYEQEEVIGKTPFDLMSPEEAKRVEILFRNIVKFQIPFERLENINLHKNGRHAVLETSGVPIFGANGKLLGYRGIDRDITDRKQAEEALRESENKYRDLVERANDGIAIVKENKLEFVNQKLAKMLGYTIEEILNKEYTRVIHPDVISTIKKRYQARIADEDVPSIYESKLKKKDGCPLDVELNVGLIDYQGDTTATLSFIRDITDRKRAEEALRESEAKYRNLVERANDGIAIIQDRKFKFLNRQAAEILGYTIEEMLNTPFFNYVHPDEHSRALKMYQARIAGKDVPSRYELKLIRKDGQITDAEINAGVISYQNSLADFAIVRDITERKRAEEQLQYQANLLQNVSDAVISSDLDFHITSWNKAAETIYGWKEEEVLGKQVGQLLQQGYPYDRKENVVNKFFNKGIWKGEVIQKRKDGTPLNILASVSLIKDEIGTPVAALAVNRDISHRKKVKKELQEKERLAAIGQLAAGVAHQLNTPLSNINLTTEVITHLITNNNSDLNRILNELEGLKKQTEFCAQIVRHLLVFSRRITITQNSINLKLLFEEIRLDPSISMRLKEKNIPIILDMDENVKVTGDKGLLLQAFQNIIMNSIDAINQAQTDLFIKISLIECNKNVKITIEDNGEGIRKKDIPRVFEPFFSTKKVGQGTGLGLSIVRGIIEKHNGQIKISSTYGKGTEVVIILPQINKRNT